VPDNSVRHREKGMNNLDKAMASAVDAVADVPEGASLAVGGFGL